MAIVLRTLARADVAALVELQSAVGPRATAARLEGQLTSPDHEGGARVRVAERDGRVVGVAGWVDDPPHFFGAPVLASDDEAAAALVDDLIARARAAAAAWIRIVCAPGEDAKHATLAAREFRVALHFSTLVCAASPRPPPALGLARTPLADADTAVVRALANAAFAGVDNSGDHTMEGARHLQDHAWPDGSGVWCDPGGAAVAYVAASRDDDGIDHVTIDEVGVAASWRRRGVARALIDATVDAAARAGAAEVRALIVSTNAASLAVHRAAGFAERWRRDVLQLDL